MRYLRDRDEYGCVIMCNTEVEQNVSSSRKPTYHSILSILATATSSSCTQPHFNTSWPNPLCYARSMHILLRPNPNLLLPLFQVPQSRTPSTPPTKPSSQANNQQHSHDILTPFHTHRAPTYLLQDLHSPPRLAEARGGGSEEGFRVERRS
jgi:hypothetical protein